MRRTAIILLLAFAIVLPYFGLWWLHRWYEQKLSDQDRVSLIIADKQTMTLSIIDRDGSCVASFPMGCGKAFGTKIEKGDNRTPEGIFRISDIQDSKEWKHDFGDGLGETAGAYGPWFIRLSTEPYKGIGIHGTHQPQSIGTRCTEGCIRLRNEHIVQLKEYAYYGLTVIILPSEHDITANNQ